MKTKHPSPENPAVAGARVLVVDDHAPARESMIETLRHAGYQADACRAAPEALARLATESYDVVITDLRMPGMSGLEFIRALRHRPHGAQIVMVTAHATVASAVEAMRHGAFDYIEKPFDADQLEQLVARALEHGHVLDQRSPVRSAGQQPTAMIGSSGVMQSLRTRIAQVAPTRETVLITGESGTGKELVARWLHGASDRRESPLVSLNCPALSSHLMESELFGHERGAFTGAENARTGRFELADKGTILLDEVTEIELSLQAKLLRVLQERSFERVGSSQTILVDVRVLATTNRDLPSEVAACRFRADLFYRLNVVPLVVPPLRDRPEDLPELVTHFLGQTAQRLQKEACTLRRDAQELLLEYHWPGNVRELENIITRASVLAAGPAIGADELRPWLIQAGETRSASTDSTESMGLRLEDMERKMIEATLDRYAGHRAKTAEALGIGLRTLSGKLKGYGYAPRAKSMAKAG
jgi:DNA-binding NtrC family response regulator